MRLSMVFPLLNRFTLTKLLIILVCITPVSANSIQPIITVALADCKKAFLIQIFENGRVEYRGTYGVKKTGIHDEQLSQEELEKLVNTIKEKRLEWHDRPGLPDTLFREAIRFRQNEEQFTFLGEYKRSDPVIALLRREIVRVTNTGRWIGDPELSHDADAGCLEKQAIIFKQLKVKQ